MEKPLDFVERLIEVATQAADLIDKLNEEEEGPMAMPPKIVQELRDAIDNVEAAWSFLSPDLLLKIRMEMPVAAFNAMTQSEIFEDNDIDPTTFQEMLDVELYGDPYAADPETVGKYSASGPEELAERSLRVIMEQDGPIEAGQQLGLSIVEVLQRYKPQIKVRCPHADGQQCQDISASLDKPCPHIEEHIASESCFIPCVLIEADERKCCKPTEDYHVPGTEEEEIP
jgi:hypothetical protein